MDTTIVEVEPNTTVEESKLSTVVTSNVTCVDAADELELHLNSREFTVVNDAVFLGANSVTVNIPPWLQLAINGAIDTATQDLLFNFSALLAELNVAKNAYTEYINIQTTIDSSIATHLTTLNASIAANSGNIVRLDNIKTTTDEVVATAISIIDASISGGAIHAQIGTLNTAIANMEGAFTASITSMIASYETQTARIDSIDMIQIGSDGYRLGSSKIATDPSGRITGWKFASSSDAPSSFDIIADKFTVSDGISSIAPLSVSNGQVHINGRLNINSNDTSMFIGEYATAPGATVTIGGVLYYVKNGDTYKNTTDGAIYVKSSTGWISQKGVDGISTYTDFVYSLGVTTPNVTVGGTGNVPTVTYTSTWKNNPEDLLVDLGTTQVYSATMVYQKTSATATWTTQSTGSATKWNGVKGVDGLNGIRGAMSVFATGLSVPPTDAQLMNAVCQAVQSTSTCTLVKGDNVTYTGTSSGTKMAYWTGSAWVKDVALYVNGDAIISGTLYADRIVAGSVDITRVGANQIGQMHVNSRASVLELGNTSRPRNSAQVILRGTTFIPLNYSNARVLITATCTIRNNNTSILRACGIRFTGSTGGVIMTSTTPTANNYWLQFDTDTTLSTTQDSIYSYNSSVHGNVWINTSSGVPSTYSINIASGQISWTSYSTQPTLGTLARIDITDANIDTLLPAASNQNKYAFNPNTGILYRSASLNSGYAWCRLFYSTSVSTPGTRYFGETGGYSVDMARGSFPENISTYIFQNTVDVSGNHNSINYGFFASVDDTNSWSCSIEEAAVSIQVIPK